MDRVGLAVGKLQAAKIGMEQIVAKGVRRATCSVRGKSILMALGLSVLLVCLILNIILLSILNPSKVLVHVQTYGLRGPPSRPLHSFWTERLAVVVPVHQGDIHKALRSLEKWPVSCSSITRGNVDLVLYKAEAEDSSSKAVVQFLEETVGRCFANTKIVYGALTEQVGTLVVCFFFCLVGHVGVLNLD